MKFYTVFLIFTSYILSAQTAKDVAFSGLRNNSPTDKMTDEVEKAQSTLKAQGHTLHFQENIGQIKHSSVLFRVNDAQATHFFTKNEVRSAVTDKDSVSKHLGYSLQFINSNPDVSVTGMDKESSHGTVNYMTERGTFLDIPSFQKVEYTKLWKGVDASFYEKDGGMEYDFIVSPNADPSVVRFRLEGTSGLKVNDKGELEFKSAFGTLQKGKPFTYQNINGKQIEIPCEYIIKDDEVSFKVGQYDPSVTLVIDPIALKWSSFLGGSAYESTNDIFVDSTTQLIYLTGTTSSLDFPNTLGRIYSGAKDNSTSGDAFITCMKADGTAILWSTYLGGSNSDRGLKIKLDANGDIYVLGLTTSSDFPLNGQVAGYDNSFYTSYQFGILLESNLFLVRLNNTGSVLKYSSLGPHFAGYSSNLAWASLAVNNAGALFVATSTQENGLATAGAFQSASSSTIKAYLFGINTNVGGSSGLLFGTYIGPKTAVATFQTSFSGITLDKDGNIWAVGSTPYDVTNDIPISPNAIQKIQTGPSLAVGSYVAFVSKFTPNGQYLYSSAIYPYYVPAVMNNVIAKNNIATNAAGDIYIMAEYAMRSATPSSVVTANCANFYSIVPFSTTINSGTTMNSTYIAKMPYSLSPKYDFVSVLPSMASGGNNVGIALDKKENIHVYYPIEASTTTQQPITAGAITTGVVGLYSAIYNVLSPSGGSVVYGTIIGGGRGVPHVQNIFVNNKCNAYLITNIDQSLSDAVFPITPTYRDFSTNTQKTVYQSVKDNSSSSAITVFHEPIPNNNTITDFVIGNNTFCTGSLIYQNPNDGPILGATPTFVSGNGSSPSHNLPNITFGSAPITHPSPGSPAITFQWQKSIDGGTIWTNLNNATSPVYKPESENTAGTVKYRRIINTFCCDTLSISNVATATITGAFNLQINAPSKPVYYCPGTAGTDLGVTVTGASGTISWQWYNGFVPLSGTNIISPSSGSGVVQGLFTATIGAGASGNGFYRLVITDASGCKKETFVGIAPKSVDAGTAPLMNMCPGTTSSVTLGPGAVNPDFSYSWTGPSGFTSTLPNPIVSTAGVYTLKVKLTTDATFCSPGTSVTVTAPSAFDPGLVNLTNKAFCQSDNPASIGLAGTPPSGYVFQWVSGTNLDNQQAYNPKFDPGIVKGGFPIGTLNYTFSALRLSDGCIFERMMVVTDTARALAQAGIDEPACGLNPSGTFGAPETQGNYFQWRAVATTYPGGLPALTSHAKFKMDGLSTNLGTNKFLTSTFPDYTSCYTIDYEIKGSYVPFPTNCYTSDVVRLFYCPTCGGPWCSPLTSNAQGVNGACSGSSTWIGGSSLANATYTWETESVDGVVQAGANRAPKGLFIKNIDGTKGAPLSIGGPHGSTAISDIDDTSWGWSGANVVVYRLTTSGNYGAGVVDCHSDIQVFSGNNAKPVISVIDQSLCTVPTPGIRLGTAGQSAPYSLNGLDYTTAPNNSFIWAWTALDGTAASTIISGATTPFPTVNPSSTTQYLVTVKDPQTGCIAKDTLNVKIKPVVANAGLDFTNVCPGSLIQLGTSIQAAYTYSWSPSSGLNFPIGTACSTCAQPYLLVPNSPAPPTTLTYTVTVTDTETGCQASDATNISTTSTTPTISAQTYNACPNNMFSIGPSISPFTVDVSTYNWTLVSGGNLSWLSATNIASPTVSLPSTFTGPAVFKCTVTNGICGSASANFTINNSNPAMILTGGTASCANGLLVGQAQLSGYDYFWSPNTALYTDNTLTTPYLGGTFSQVYARPNVTTTYTLTRSDITTGCTQTATVTVAPPTGVAIDAGIDKSYCIGGSAITIGSTGTGTLSWSAIGYDPNPYANTPATIAAPMTSAIMLGYIGGSANSPTRSFATGTPLVGRYVYRVSSISGGCTISDDVVVIVPNLPKGVAGLPQNLCPGDSIQLGSTSNPTSLAYNWSAINPTTEGYTISDPSAARPYVTPSVNTTYQVVYTDVLSGCTVQEQVPVVINPKPNIADVSTSITCTPIAPQNLTTLVSGYGAVLNPIWYRDQYPGGTVISTPTNVTPTATTKYYLLSQNSYGCYDTAQMIINLANPQRPNIAPMTSLNCNTNTVDLANYQGTASQSGYTLEWHNANNTNSGTILNSTIVGPGTYYLFEKAPNPANCYSASDSIVIQLGNCCPTITNPSPTQTICIGKTGTDITVYSNQNTVSSIKFVKFTTDQTVTNGSETAAELAAIYAGSGIVTVTPTGSGSPYTATYAWNNADFPNTGSTPITYYVYAILNPDAGTSCRPVQEIKIVINPQPTTPSVTSPVNNVCPSTKVSLIAISAALVPSVLGGLFEWHVSNLSSSALVGTPTSVSAGTYYLFEKSPDGCYSNEKPVSISIQACCPPSFCLPITVIKGN